MGLKATQTELTNNDNTLSSAILLKSNSTDVCKTEVNQQIAILVDSVPSTLNTLQELAGALGDDQSFSTTVTNCIATKQPLLTTYNSSLPIFGNTNTK